MIATLMVPEHKVIGGALPSRRRSILWKSPPTIIAMTDINPDRGPMCTEAQILCCLGSELIFGPKHIDPFFSTVSTYSSSLDANEVSSSIGRKGVSDEVKFSVLFEKCQFMPANLFVIDKERQRLCEKRHERERE